MLIWVFLYWTNLIFTKLWGFLFLWAFPGRVPSPLYSFFHGYAVGIISIPLFSLLLPLYHDVSAIYSVRRFPLAIKALLLRQLAISEPCIFGKLSSCTRSMELTRCHHCCNQMPLQHTKHLQILPVPSCRHCWLSLSYVFHLSGPSDSWWEGGSSFVIGYIPILMLPYLQWLSFQLSLVGVCLARPHSILYHSVLLPSCCCFFTIEFVLINSLCIS